MDWVHNHVSFRETLTDLVERGRHKIVIDFSELTYMGSSGLEVILSHIQRVRDAGGDMVLAAMSPKIYKVFDLLGLPKFFNITDSMDDALSAFHE
ncbi:MAG: STAS domain-containing protein [Acidobacteriota bacterium]